MYLTLLLWAYFVAPQAGKQGWQYTTKLPDAWTQRCISMAALTGYSLISHNDYTGVISSWASGKCSESDA